MFYQKGFLKLHKFDKEIPVLKSFCSQKFKEYFHMQNHFFFQNLHLWTFRVGAAVKTIV